LKTCFKELRPLVQEAVNSLNVLDEEKRGSKSSLDLEQKVLILLLKHLFNKSNRNMSNMLIIFSWLTDISVSYKTIERLYSDEEAIFALHNLHILILQKKGIINPDCSGDGTGYSLNIREHYATHAQKLKSFKKQKSSEKIKTLRKKFIYSFALMDLKTRLYVCFGMSLKSEKEAFLKALNMAKETGIEIKSLRLDKYYSCQSYVKTISDSFENIEFYLIPKSNATIRGSWSWKKMLFSFVNKTIEYLEEYYKRNQSESGFSEDKKRTGWKLGQKKPIRIFTANALTHVWHNLYWLG
jgi:transposase